MTDQRVAVYLYGLSTCPWSRNARAWLDGRHVKYDFVDYDLAAEDVQAHIQEEMLSRGASAFPFVRFGDSDFIIGYNPDAYARLLDLPQDAELGTAAVQGMEPEGPNAVGKDVPKDGEEPSGGGRRA